ncbi:MAG TPA: hypothetical protein EYH53_04625 [Methanothermococcus okinawensis]|nr:hypothetical protein [Methanothermococcus okinawensis]
MIGLSKFKSNKGYIFTFEAIVAVMVVLLIFYVGYFAITHNILTFHEKKRDIEAFEKSNLIANKIFKDHEFPSDSYVPDYLRFVDRVRERYYTSRDTIPGTFDPFSFSDVYKYSVSYNLTIYSNVNITSVASYRIYNLNNIYIKEKNLLVPVKTWKYNNSNMIFENVSIGEILYLDTEKPSQLMYINISAQRPTDVTLSVNGVPFNMSINTTPKISEFGKVWEIYEPNEIKILNISHNAPITLNVVYSAPSTIYVLKLKPTNISCIIPLKN